MMQSLVIGVVIIPLIMAAFGASPGAIFSTIILNIFLSFAINQWQKLFRYNKERKLRKQLQPIPEYQPEIAGNPNGDFIQVINIHPPQGYQNAKQYFVTHEQIEKSVPKKTPGPNFGPNEHRNRESMLEY